MKPTNDEALPGQAHPGKRSRGRPRAELVDQTILAAAHDILANQGYDALSFKAIEQATGITRASVYRRWRTKAHLAAEVAHGVDQHLVDTIRQEDLRGQIRSLVSQLCNQYLRPEVGAASAGLIAAYQRDPDLRRELHNPREQAARDDLARIVEVARQSGQIRADVKSDTLFDMLVGTVIYRIVFSSLPSEADIVQDVSAMVLDGIAVRPD
ncbi:MAG TPA: TetR/AcrR family transcriptional regulator [Sphingomonas sp.]|nr:TetR/AcrR family transcriptional regulator [Sphingomonas sp.]